MEKLVSLCKRRGFIFQSSEIYGGINGFWDYGPLGVELKNNLRDVWRDSMVRNPPPGPDGEEPAGKRADESAQGVDGREHAERRRREAELVLVVGQERGENAEEHRLEQDRRADQGEEAAHGSESTPGGVFPAEPAAA